MQPSPQEPTHREKKRPDYTSLESIHITHHSSAAVWIIHRDRQQQKIDFYFKNKIVFEMGKTIWSTSRAEGNKFSTHAHNFMGKTILRELERSTGFLFLFFFNFLNPLAFSIWILSCRCVPCYGSDFGIDFYCASSSFCDSFSSPLLPVVPFPAWICTCHIFPCL